MTPEELKRQGALEALTRLRRHMNNQGEGTTLKRCRECLEWLINEYKIGEK
jgi:hypothetical protein